MFSPEVMAVLERIETEDQLMRERGLTDDQKAAWGVAHNPGLWIIDRKVAEFLYDFILNEQPKVIVEIGTSVGYSAIWMGEAARQYGGRITTIEKENFKFKDAEQNLKEAGTKNIELLLGDGEQTLKAWSRAPIDLLFLDGNKRGYLPQFQAALPHLSERAWVIADNITDMAEQVANFREAIEKHPEFEVEIEEIGDGLLVAERRVR